ncbi:MAG TPA: hypothetical protein VKZ47_02845 [Acidimicrobiia bacterium]|nr:hypothetical protein [Acidimicrobiia bacterium]
MDSWISFFAGAAATVFAVDLWINYARKPRPHVLAYGIGITMFALATWALFGAMVMGWNPFLYRVFFLFGAVLNIPYLALGSMFLVGGKRAGHIMTVLLGAFSAIAITLVSTVGFQRELPEGGIPHDIFASGFGPRMFAAIGGGMGATILIVLALVSIIRFRKTAPRVMWGSLLILLGTLAASAGGTNLALGEASTFALSLFLAATLIFAGYKVASGARRAAKTP